MIPLEVRGLRKRYRRRVVLDGLDLEVRPGEAVALIGANGAGKSTLLGCITGDRLPDAGEVRISGADPFRDPRAAAAAMGVVPEQPYLYGELTVGEMLRFCAEARRLDAAAAGSEAARLLGMLGLAGSEEVPCRELSQGMGRKTAIAMALLHRPPLLLLDEALNGLDQPSAAALVAELEVRRRGGAAVLVSSHDLGFLASWCSRGVMLERGARWSVLEGEAWTHWRGMPSLGGAAASSPAAMGFAVEGVIVLQGRKGAYLTARQVYGDGDFRVTEGSTLGSFPLEPFLDVPRAVEDSGEQRRDVFVFHLSRSEDAASVRVGDVLELRNAG